MTKHKPSKINVLNSPPQLADIDLANSFIKNKQQYTKQINYWQKKLMIIQQAYFHQKKRAIIVFEGWDASGKGGTIRRLTQRLDPRGYRVHPIAAPSPIEQGKHYLYRFQQKLPSPGELCIFDRSYYGRVLVERVEGFATEQEWQRAYHEINEFERLLSDDGVRIIKLFLHISPQEQLERFAERLNNPYKTWKLTEEDIRNREKWHQYETSINDMFKFTHTLLSPWNVIAAEHKWFVRVNALKTIAQALSCGVDIEPIPVDPFIVKLAKQKLGIVVE